MKTRRQFSREFRVEAVKLVTERGVAAWMLWRTRRDQIGHGHSHEHDHHHEHDEPKRVDTGHGTVWLDVLVTGVPPRFRLHT